MLGAIPTSLPHRQRQLVVTRGQHWVTFQLPFRSIPLFFSPIHSIPYNFTKIHPILSHSLILKENFVPFHPVPNET